MKKCLCVENKSKREGEKIKSKMRETWLLRIFREAQIASNDVFEQPHAGIPDKRGDHVAKNVGNSKESLGSLADVIEPSFINQDLRICLASAANICGTVTHLLNNEGGDCSAQLAAGLHDAETQGYYFCSEQEVDDIAVVNLNKRTNDAQRGQAQVFERPSFADRVEKRIEKQGDVGLQEAGASFRMASDALQQGQRVAHPIGRLRLKHRRVQHWIYACDLLQQNSYGTKTVPKNRREVRKSLTLLAEL